MFYFIGSESNSSGATFSNLMGLSLSNGSTTVKTPLPFDVSLYYGAGTAVEVDPATGDVIVVGQQKPSLSSLSPSKDQAIHPVLRLDFTTKALQAVCVLDNDPVLFSFSFQCPN
jgi:hypothetical protein